MTLSYRSPRTREITRTAITRRNARPPTDDWKTCAVPWNVAGIVIGRISFAAFRTRAVASLSATPRRTLKEIVADGTCPRWFTERGPAFSANRATDESGMRVPAELRT